MYELTRHVEAVSCKNQNKIKSLIDPLANIYGVNAHAYYRIDSQGLLTLLCNFPEISQYYFSNELHINNPFLKHPDLVNSGFFLASSIENIIFQQAQTQMEKKCQLHNLLFIFEKEGDVLHAHGLATTHPANLTNLYLNNMERLRLYCAYFRDETTSLLNPINFGKITGKTFYQKADQNMDKEAQKKFFHWLNAQTNNLDLYKPLSVREMECLKLLLEGMPASQIAEELSITTRTTEHHLDHIKDKLLVLPRPKSFLSFQN